MKIDCPYCAYVPLLLYTFIGIFPYFFWEKRLTDGGRCGARVPQVALHDGGAPHVDLPVHIWALVLTSHRVHHPNL